MERVIEYRKNAEECREIAGKLRDPGQREQLLKIAQHWDDLAEEREKYLQVRKRLSG